MQEIDDAGRCPPSGWTIKHCRRNQAMGRSICGVSVSRSGSFRGDVAVVSRGLIWAGREWS